MKTKAEVNKVANGDSCGSNGHLCNFSYAACGRTHFALPLYSL